MKTGPILYIEDDTEDQEIFADIINELGIENRILFFSNGSDALHYLKTTEEQPFIIFSDINLPGLNGIDFKHRIDDDPMLRRKSIPFIFYSTSASKSAVEEAFTELLVQGFFRKNSNFEEIKNCISMILTYWKHCIHPNAN